MKRTDSGTNSNAVEVRALQARAADAFRQPRRRVKARASRAAMLHLIDVLSRWGGAGLAAIAGVAIFLSVSAGQTAPFAAAQWTCLVLAALYVARRLHQGFRRGDRIAGRPFRWRSNYTAALAVVSAAMGSAIWILPAAAFGRFDVALLTIAAAAAAAMLHAAHPASAASAGSPAAALALAGYARFSGFDSGFFLLATGSLSLFLATAWVSRRLLRQATARFPRMRPLRREIDHPDAETVARAPTAPDLGEARA